jgi:broad specificity phosphatase PhoE
MPNTIVYLIRHSIPESVVKKGERLMYGPPAPLSPAGREKAARLAESLLAREGKPFDVIYSSPYQRAYDTACIIAEKMALNPVVTNAGLRDTDSEWGGVPMEELALVARAGRLFTDPRTHESVAGIASRMIAAYNECVSPHPGKTIGIVSHGDPLRILYDRICNPEEDIPPYAELVSGFNLEVAQSLRLEFFRGGRIETERVV